MFQNMENKEKHDIGLVDSYAFVHTNCMRR
jgi:hypothetical protein